MLHIGAELISCHQSEPRGALQSSSPKQAQRVQAGLEMGHNLYLHRASGSNRPWKASVEVVGNVGCYAAALYPRQKYYLPNPAALHLNKDRLFCSGEVIHPLRGM